MVENERKMLVITSFIQHYTGVSSKSKPGKKIFLMVEREERKKEKHEIKQII